MKLEIATIPDFDWGKKCKALRPALALELNGCRYIPALALFPATGPGPARVFGLSAGHSQDRVFTPKAAFRREVRD